MPRPQPKKHTITVDEAAKITARHRNQASARAANKRIKDGDLGGLFTKEEVISMLQNPKAKYLRFYYGQSEEGSQELVLLSADADGNDLMGDEAVALDSHLPCPPFCPDAPSLLRG